MRGKQPKSVITDGDLAMKNAISMVFPTASHRLCSWHLLRNATSRLGMPRFLSKFRTYLMADLEVEEFESIWADAVEEFGLEQNSWVLDMYEKRGLWSNAHIRGKFFVGLKTTSSCEALNMQIGKFIHNGYNLREFIEHFQHYLEFMRRRELVADYRSLYGEPAPKTKLHELEGFAATVYTKEVFMLFREVLLLASNVRVVSSKRTSACTLFEVGMYRKEKIWSVAWDEEEDDFQCSCLRMESFGLPCVHIVGVLISLDLDIIPPKMVLNRWTKKAKQPTQVDGPREGEIPDSAYMSMHAAMMDDCRELVKLSCRNFGDYYEVKKRINAERDLLREKNRDTASASDFGDGTTVQDMKRARHRGCGRRVLTSKGKFRRVQRCRRCGRSGHNARKCDYTGQVGGGCTQGSQNLDRDGASSLGDLDAFEVGAEMEASV
ncbi:hypothetical protein PIB30_117286 [Stylosanthes scabra]|uniref:Protein FAR1-RELATED SEQUENCE n=1 Tax=Stylosanthes scabra TaxID=79078 RepID=A0ABU6TEE7_9FABA|nr:hypothetical protein [Stylosanthes scabra]